MIYGFASMGYLKDINETFGKYSLLVFLQYFQISRVKTYLALEVIPGRICTGISEEIFETLKQVHGVKSFFFFQKLAGEIFEGIRERFSKKTSEGVPRGITEGLSKKSMDTFLRKFIGENCWRHI